MGMNPERTDTRDRFIIALDDAVRPLADPAQITATCARLLCEHLDANRCAYAEVHEDEDTFDLTGDHNRGVQSIVGRYRFADFGAQVLRLMREGLPYVVDDVERHQPPIGDLSAYRQTEIRAVVCVPLIKGAKLVAAMAVHQSQPRHWNAEEIDLVLHVTGRCLESIERARALRRLRESEERFRIAALVATSIVWTNAASGRMLGEQPGWQAFTGQSRQACQGYGWADAVHPADVPATLEAWNAAVAARNEFIHRHRVRRADGAWRVCDIRALPLFEATPPDAPRSVREWVGVHTDITERLAFEQTLQESESRFRNLSDNAPVMIWVTRADGYCEHLNRGWLDFTGQTFAQAEGFGWLNAVHPEDAAAAETEFLNSNAEHRAFKVEYRLRRRDGVYRWCIDSAAPRTGPNGEPFGFIGSVIDISERKLIETVLSEEKRVLQLIATGASMVTTLDAIVTHIELRSEGALRCAILRCDGDRLHVASAPSLPADYFDTLRGWPIGPASDTCGTAAHEKRTVVTEDLGGASFPPTLRAMAVRHGLGAAFSVPIFSASGAVYGTFAAYYRHAMLPERDHIELVRAATHLAGIVLNKHTLDEQLAQSLSAEQTARGEAERANRMKDEFLATLSHELRTPLSAILGWVALLRRRGELPEEVERGIAVIERNARAQAQIIADLLDTSAIVSGKVRLDLTPIDLQTFVALAVETMRPTALGKGIEIGFTPDSRANARVSGDTNRLQQILWNLLSNAVKFSKVGGRIDVSLSVQTQAQEVVLEVRDDGEGIAPAFLPFVFDRFRQADATSTRTQGGMGLGLSIVKTLVELHGGSVEAHSDGVGQGAVFTVRLPLDGELDMPSGFSRLGGAPFAPAALPATQSDAQADATLRGLRVLLVDDEPDGRETTQRLLEHKRVFVTTAGSAAEALRLFEQQTFDAIVSDIGMPMVDGYRLLQQVRALEAERDGERTPAIALTAYARPEDRAQAMDAGFDRHLAKPVDPARLFAALLGVARSQVRASGA